MNFYPDFSKSLEKAFFCRDTVSIAKDLLGKVLVKRESIGSYLASIITETEAYLSENDFASHSAVGKTKRNQAMFEEGGIAYIYKIYGIHYCFNIVTENQDIGSAVLIRSAIPILGIDTMKQRRNNAPFDKLCYGPGNLAKSYGFNLNFNFKNLLEDSLFIQTLNTNENISEHIIATPRKGISKSSDLQLRFILKNEKLLFQKYLLKE